MSIHFHKLTIKEIRKETADCVSISFCVPAELKDTFSFSQGQNITLRAVINGEDVRRSYSICSAPYEGDLRVAVKKTSHGLFSRYANEQLQAGDTLEVLPPTGNFFTPLHPEHQKNYLAFAAGSGITPVIGIIKSTFATEPRSTFTLVYGSRTRSSVIFLEELEGLKNKYLGRFNLIYILSGEKTETELNYGRIDTNKLGQLRNLVDYKSFDDFFICGPEAMIFCIKDYLRGIEVDERKIHFELFTVPGKKNVQQKERVDTAAETKSKITIKLDGRSFDMYLASDGEDILDAALKQGIDLPFACKGGVCSTCKAKLIEGAVEMDVNWALEPEEVEQGFILTCQSHPKTKEVVVDFDIK